MPDRYRRYVSAIFVTVIFFGVPLAIWGAASLGQVERSQERSAASAAYSDYAEQQKYCTRDGVFPGPQMTDCLIKRAQAAHEYEQAQADLRAQQEVAVWTGGVFALGLVGYLISIAGIVFLYANLRMLQRQINDAADAVEQEKERFAGQLSKMDDANNIAHNIGDAQLRPYPMMTTGSKLRIVTQKETVDFEFSFTITNAGETPLFDADFSFEVFIWPDGEPFPAEPNRLSHRAFGIANIVKGAEPHIVTDAWRQCSKAAIYKTISGAPKGQRHGSLAFRCRITGKDFAGKTVPDYLVWICAVEPLNFDQQTAWEPELSSPRFKLLQGFLEDPKPLDKEAEGLVPAKKKK